MKIIAKISTVVFLVSLGFQATAQQEEMFTHYMDNTLAVNPAYAGSRDALTITALHRSQWVGFDGAPITQTLTLHTPVKSKHIGLGLSIVNDKTGPVRNTAMYIDFAYIMELSAKSKLSFGIKGGADLINADLASLQLDQSADKAFQNNINSKLLPNVGFGAYFYRPRFYAGISVPKLLENNFNTDQTISTTKLNAQQRHYYFITGAVFRLSENVELKPTAYLKATAASPIEGEVTGTFIFYEKFLAGPMFRTGDAAGVLIGFNFTPQLHLGYSFDYSYGVTTFKYNGGSHEIMLKYDFIFNDRGKIRSPRYF